MAGLANAVLLSNAGAGNGAAIVLPVAGQYSFYAEATWGGGNVQLQFQSGLGTWINVTTGGNITANGNSVIQLMAGSYRAVVTTATAVTAALIPVTTATTR